MAEIDTTGAWVWVGQVGGVSFEMCYGNAITITNQINVCGSFEGNISFDGITLIGDIDDNDIYVTQLLEEVHIPNNTEIYPVMQPVLQVYPNPFRNVVTLHNRLR